MGSTVARACPCHEYKWLGLIEAAMGYDVIGDVHGHADALVALLSMLGYRERAGA